MKSSRLVAFEILCDVFRDNAYSNLAIEKALRKEDIKEKAFVSSLVYGVVERKITLDYIITPYLNGTVKSKVRNILYIGAYQLYFMNKVPEPVAINECVELAKQVGVSYYKNMINAVLRNVAKNKIDVDGIDDLSVRYSCPAHLINMWKKMYGEENTLGILDSINNKPPVFAIPNFKYVNADELLYELNDEGIEGEIVDDVVMITSRFDLSNSRAFKNGLFYIEDLSSFSCACSLGAKEDDIVFDMCAAPGGKSFTISQCMNNKGRIFAFDMYDSRVKLIEDSAQRLGIDIIEASINDAEIFNNSLPLADKILCDVPCSGFGIVRRKPEIRYKDLDSIKELPEIQFNILSTSANYLKNGGRIIYSTCTLNKKENERVVSRFLDSNPEYKLIDQNTVFPSANGGDGFFWSVMERNND